MDLTGFLLKSGQGDQTSSGGMMEDEEPDQIVRMGDLAKWTFQRQSQKLKS